MGQERLGEASLLSVSSESRPLRSDIPLGFATGGSVLHDPRPFRKHIEREGSSLRIPTIPQVSLRKRKEGGVACTVPPKALEGNTIPTPGPGRKRLFHSRTERQTGTHPQIIDHVNPNCTFQRANAGRTGIHGLYPQRTTATSVHVFTC